ncbi:MAG: lamin tail domain-containing protein [Bacteroidia bacterium]|nr:lamin tail domain-containing protein [Bacteroidia bacterium]
MKLFRTATLIMLAVLIFEQCKTEDVSDNGSWTWKFSKDLVNEGDSTVTISVKLAKPVSTNTKITLEITGNATLNEDFFIDHTSWNIAAGDTIYEAVITILQDTALEQSETIIFNVAQLEGLESPTPSQLVLTIEDDDQPNIPNILLNEILYDPSNNLLDGDANGDGVYAQAADEFIEIINYSSKPLDISGFKVFDSENFITKTPNHTFPANTLLKAGKCLVLFGGGMPKGTFGGALVQTSTSGDLNLNNAGDIIYITDKSDNILLQFDIEPLSNNPNESYSRNPDLTGDFIQHSVINGKYFSPGSKSNGDPF